MGGDIIKRELRNRLGMLFLTKRKIKILLFSPRLRIRTQNQLLFELYQVPFVNP